MQRNATQRNATHRTACTQTKDMLGLIFNAWVIATLGAPASAWFSDSLTIGMLVTDACAHSHHS